MFVPDSRAATLAVAVALTLAPAGSLAQSAPPRELMTPPPTSNTLRFGGTAGDFQRRLAGEAVERQREQGPSPRDVLIERVAPLVAAGQCEAARRLAREDGDRALSRRIGTVCIEGRPTQIG